ncbi:aminotransferase class I/II-fold pyridoxal phosphate-dependent enzyme [Eubacteriales bacterium OttesenSCG-928-M02]|nr:aminotransferase class I/II-fold pyridoxal phosphate-dependent enzyme [Eubacteriales bacterium OttesenSCG-928-M02]
MNWETRIAGNVKDMPPSGIRKFFDIASEIKDAISLSVGEPDFVTPWNIIENAIYALERGRTHYTSNSGLIELRELICRYYLERFGVTYAPSQVLVTVGASEAIDLAVRALVEPGDEVLIPAPTYVSYAPTVELAHGVPIGIPTDMAHEFKLDGDVVKSLITEKTKAIIVPYPNNPTGAVMDRADLQALADALADTNVVVISDEIYAELTYGGTHVSIASIPGMYERTVVLNGFSKAFAMTGWRLGYAAGPPEVLNAMLKIHQYTMLCANITSQYAGVEALRHGFETNFDSVVKMREEYNRRRNYIVSELNRIGLTCFEPRGAFYAFPNITVSGQTSEAFCEGLLFQKKVAVVPGTAFGQSGEGHVRISYAASMENIKLAISRMEEYLEEL